MLYQKILRPLLFSFDAETVHNRMLRLLRLASRTDLIKNFIQKNLFIDDPRLHCSLGNVKLANPIGLAAGFDKFVDAPLAYPMLGFGFAELGSFTYQEQPGNPKPRLWRITKDKCLIVYYGLANCGALKAKERIKDKLPVRHIPYGLSIAPSTEIAVNKMSEDYLASFLELQGLADYLTLNVSCPNVIARDVFTQISFIEELLSKIHKAKQERNIDKDVFVKVGPDMNFAEVDKIIDLCLKFGITGIIATNLVKKRENLPAPLSSERELNHPGGISGQLLKDKSTRTIRYIYQRAGGKLKIIGLGGVFTAADAYQKILYGASAVQLITGWIYGGPLTIKKINNDLLNLLKKDGFKNIGEAVGKEAR